MAQREAEFYIEILYRDLLRRPADPDGLSHFADRLRAGEPLERLADAIVSSEEYQQKSLGPAVARPATFKRHQRRPLTIVDLGAQALAGEAHVYAPLSDAGLEVRCLGFEPQRDKLEERIARDGSASLVMDDAFVGDGSHRTFFINSDSGSSSLLRLNVPFNQFFEHIGGLVTLREDQVKTQRLDELLGEEVDIDFLKLDIQGFELNALIGAERLLRRTNVIHCEVFFGPMYVESAMFSDIEQFLRARGFAFIDFSHLNRYPIVEVKEPTGQRDRLIWGDAVFFRTLPDEADDHALFAQAAIAALVYGKYGLAQQVMQHGGLRA